MLYILTSFFQAKTIIEENLEKRPQLLTKELWGVLRWGLGERLRTPQEEQNHLFERAPIVNPPDTKYVNTLIWMLKRCMSAFPESELMQFQFVDVANLSIEVARYGSVWKINGKWLTKEGSHKHIFCPDQFKKKKNLSPCQHTLRELWEHMADLWKQTEGQSAKDDTSQPDQDFDYIKRKIARCIDDTPRGITCTKTSRAQELTVSWGPTDRALQIVMHHVICPFELTEPADRPRRRFFNHGHKDGKSESININQSIDSISDQACTCPSKIVGTKTRSFTFENLSPEVEHRPSVSGCYKDAFIAFPPQPIKPRYFDANHAEPIELMDISEESDCVSEGSIWEPYGSSSETYDSDEDAESLIAPVAGNHPPPVSREPPRNLTAQDGSLEDDRSHDRKSPLVTLDFMNYL